MENRIRFALFSAWMARQHIAMEHAQAGLLEDFRGERDLVKYAAYNLGVKEGLELAGRIVDYAKLGAIMYWGQNRGPP